MGQLTPLLVTGSERSGTLFVAEVLRRAGIDAGHERAVDIHGAGPFDVEVSWLAAPLKFDCFTVHQTRHPLKAVASSVARGTFDWEHRRSAWGRYAARWCPAILDEPDPLRRALRYWHDWNLLADGDVHWRVEDLSAEHVEQVLESTGRPAKVSMDVPTDVHTAGHEVRLTWEQVCRWPVGREVRELAGRLGYR